MPINFEGLETHAPILFLESNIGSLEISASLDSILEKYDLKTSNQI